MRKTVERDTCRRWFRYVPEDAKAAQAELDRLADEGWELVEFGIFCVSFHRAERPRRCWVEPARWGGIGRKDERKKDEYLMLCSEAGWELVEETNGLFYFRAKAGMEPAPIQTDSGVEWEAVLRKTLWDRGYNLIFKVLFWAFYFSANIVKKGFHPWEILLSDTALLVMVMLAVWVAVDIARGVYVIRYRARCRGAAGVGAAFPIPGSRGARLRGCLGLVSVALVAVILIAALMGTGERKQSGDLGGLLRWETVSVFARYTEYARYGEDALRMDDYDCRSVWLAERICRDLTADEGVEKRVEYHWHPPVVPRAAQLPFDEAYTYDAGAGDGLILRQGSRTIRVETTADLSGIADLQALWSRLGLEGTP